MSTPESALLLTHFLQRINKDISRIDSLIQAVHLDVHFLVEVGQINSDDAALILSKVPVLAGSSPGGGRRPHHLGRSRADDGLGVGLGGLGGLGEMHGVDAVAPPSYPSLENVHNVPRSNSLPMPMPPPAPKKQARAFWDYNLDLEEPDDLSFEKGAIIDVIQENNEDWWTGKSNGRIGIFPSNYVEVLQHPLPTWSTGAPPATALKARPPPPESAPKYVPYKPSMTNINTNMTNNNTTTATATGRDENGVNPIGLKPAAVVEDDTKKPKYLSKHTLANAAAGGLGFGAGAAIGGSVVRAIF